jgi:hypothetical protein
MLLAVDSSVMSIVPNDLGLGEEQFDLFLLGFSVTPGFKLKLNAFFMCQD